MSRRILVNSGKINFTGGRIDFGTGVVPPPPLGSPPVAYFIAFGAVEPLETDFLGSKYISDNDITSWVGDTFPAGSPLLPINTFAPSARGLVYASSIDTWVLSLSSSNGLYYSTDDGVTWLEAPTVDSFVAASGGRSAGVAWSPTLGLFVAGGNSGKIQRSSDGITWLVSEGSGSPTTVFGSDQIYSITWSEDIGMFLCGTNNNRIGRSVDGINWVVEPVEPGGASSADIDVIKAIGTRVFIGRDSITNNVLYRDYMGGSPLFGPWTAPTFDIPPSISFSPIIPAAQIGGIAANEDASIILVGAGELNSAEYVWRSTDGGLNFTRIDISAQLYGSPRHQLFTTCLMYDTALGLFVLGGEDNTADEHIIMTSPDGLTWTLQLSEQLLHAVGSPETIQTNRFLAIASKAQT